MADGQTTPADATLSPEPKETPETFTKDQVAKMVKDAKSSVLADAKRFQTEAEKALKAATAAQERLNKLEQERINAEIEAHKDEPAYIKSIRAEQEARQLRADLAQREQELQEERQARAKFEAERTELSKAETAREIATRLNVDASKLAKLSKYTDGSQEAIEEIARDLPKVSTPAQPPAGGKPDSGQGRGGNSQGKTPTLAELKASSPEATEAKVKSGEWVIPGWR